MSEIKVNDGVKFGVGLVDVGVTTKVVDFEIRCSCLFSTKVEGKPVGHLAQTKVKYNGRRVQRKWSKETAASTKPSVFYLDGIEEFEKVDEEDSFKGDQQH